MNARVLVVDDEAAVREAVSGILSADGYQVRAAGTAAEGLAVARDWRPDVAIADVRLPDASGLTLVGQLHTACGADLPVILLSAMGAERDILQGFAAGASDYLVKPCGGDELIAKIRRYAPRGARPRRDVPATLANGRLRLGARLGSGGMGHVYLAEDRILGRTVAVKVLRSDLAADRTNVSRFLNEARALRDLQVQGVPRIHAMGTEGVVRYLVMDLLPGVTLRRRVEQDGPLRGAALLTVACDLARILAALGEERLVHRDVKPDNVMVAPDGTAGLFDFGLARRMGEPRLTAEDSVVGTAGYVAPEQLSGHAEPDARGDVFALAMTLWYAATGEEPSPDCTSGTSLLRAMAANPLDLTRRPLGLPAEFDELFHRMAALDPKWRPATAAEVHHILDRMRSELVI